MHITINQRAMTFEPKDGGYTLPPLYSTNKHGNVMEWTIAVHDNHIHRTSTQQGGRVKSFAPITMHGKNQGRQNETSPHEQALFHAYSLWLKKQDQGYTCTPSSSPPLLPMLAQKYTDRGQKYLQRPFGASPKLDGIRMMARHVDGDVLLTSRLGKPFTFLDVIRHHLSVFPADIILDGELYTHALPFSVLSGVVRATRTKSEHDATMEYWIFDLVTEKPYRDRMTDLKALERLYHRHFPSSTVLRFVYYSTIDHDDVQKMHDSYVAQGYEGIILRNLESPYQPRHRSNDLQKYKNFHDEEFQIVGAKQAVGTEEGAIVFECQSNTSEETFDVRPRGTIQQRRRWWEERDLLMGKLLTVRYQTTDGQNLPRFPVGIHFRDYE